VNSGRRGADVAGQWGQAGPAHRDDLGVDPSGVARVGGPAGDDGAPTGPGAPG